MVTTTDGWEVAASESRATSEVFADAVRVLTEAARLRRPVSIDPHETRTERADFAEFVSLGLAAVAANMGGVEELLAGRPGSWEADYVRNLLSSTVGYDEAYLWEHRTEPLVIRVPVDHILTELGVWDLYDESVREIDERECAIGVVYAVTRSSNPTGLTAPLREELVSAVTGELPGDQVGEELTEGQEAELERLAAMRDALEEQMRAEWTAYGQGFKASVEAELEREPIPGLQVPVEFDIDDRTSQVYDGSPEPETGPIARLYQAGWDNTALPGSKIPLRDYASWLEVAATERAAGRLPHLRLQGYALQPPPGPEASGGEGS